jgi:hypothetical protein
MAAKLTAQIVLSQIVSWREQVASILASDDRDTGLRHLQASLETSELALRHMTRPDDIVE